ncbi:hypothetical protein G6011_04450 [Alternaria panax]|uniref:Uncharacterized protein n=1 Tax=Alternaria panax TaxID=48097 RepID=A0AAD4IGW4_9PLEO|nr:hypothetical protein G6011_04450 [Alternaria panax]
MSNNASFPNHKRADIHFESAPFIAPTAQMFPASAGLNVYDINRDSEFLPTEEPNIYAGENRVWRYDPPDPDDSHGNAYQQQFQILPAWNLPGQLEHFEPDPAQFFGTDVALDIANGFTNEYEHPPVEPTPSYDDGSLTPSPNQPDNGNIVGAGEDAETVAVVDAVSNSLLDKERQAKAVLKKQRSQNSAAKRMGESVTISQTETGLEIKGVYWTAPADDNTIPSSPAKINACIDQLTRAIQNKENCREKTTTGQYRNRWSAESTYYSEDHFKAAARELVLAMVDIHNDGWTKTIYDKGERENCQATMFYTFEDRFKALRELLHCSKTTCQDILKGTRFYTIIGNPRTLTFRTATNKTANAHKAGLIAKGKVTSNSEKHPASEAHSGPEDRSNNEESLQAKESLQPQTSSKSKKRAHEDVLQVEEELDVNVPRPKAAAKKRRKA